ncbi:MAG: RHS repeat protein, partial [Burkholderiales bacterium]|nr:RHS repeat protein [Burkholderiales bacterium]
EGATSITRQNAFGEVTWSQDARGAVSVQNYDTNGRLTSTVQAQGSLNLTASNVYDTGGRLTQTTDARGTVTKYVYDDANRLTQRIVDQAGLNLVTSYAYDTEGRVIQTTDPEGRVTNTTFDALGRVLSIIVDPAGLAIETRFAYPDKQVTEITHAFGTAEARLTRHTYDRAGRLVQTQVDPSGLNLVTQYAYDKAGNVVRKTDAAGYVTRYAYDANGQLAYEVDALLGVTRFEYDGLGHIVAQTRYAIPIALLPAEESVALTTAVIAGKLVANAQQDRATRTAYDRDGRLRYSVDALGYVREQVWDANGNLVRTIAYAVPVALEGLLTAAQVATAVAGQATAAANRVETSVYDAANRQVFRIDVLGTVTQNTFDAGGNLVTQVRYKTAYTATAVPTEAQMTTWLAQSGIKDAAKDRTQRWFYDAANRQRVAIDAGGAITEFGYNKVGEVIRRAQYLNSYTVANGASLATVLALLPAAPTTVTATVPTGMRVTLYQYDAAGRAISEGLAGYQQVTRAFDRQGQVTKVTTRDLVSSVQSEILYGYDRAGRLGTQTEATGVAGVSVTTQYEYDGNGRLIKEVDGRGNLKYAGYDGVGRRTTVTDAYGKITQTDYNLFGEAVKVTDALGNAGYFYFDRLGRNTLQVDPEGYVTQTTYGATDRPLTVTRYATKATGTWGAATPPAVVTTAPTEAGAVYVLAVTARDAVTKFEYDKADRLAKTTDAEGKFESYAYDGFGDRISHTNKLGGVFQYIYDKMGRLTKETLPVTSKNAAGTPIAVVNQFAYDLAGNLTSKIEAVGLPEQRTTTMIYDVRGLMTERRGQARTTYVYGTGTAANIVPKETWKYDGRGNTIEYKDARLGATTWTYDARNLRRTETRADGGRTEWDYDEVGNVAVQRVYGDLNLDSNKTYRETRYTYDALNRVIETRMPGLQWARFNTATNIVEGLTGDAVVITRYDALGRVVSVKDANYNANNGGGITYYFYDKVGNKVFQVDGESYATSWTYDAEGNLLQERRYATQYVSTLLNTETPENIDLETLRAGWTVTSSDRVKTYTYDRNGRKLTEGIGGFVYSNVSATGGLTSSTTTATTRYAYDAMGNLAYQTDARSNRVDYTYDTLGRLTQNQQATFVDYRDQSVRATTQYVYNGLNAVVQETKLGAGAADRVSTFTYDAGLLKTQNIAGVVTTYDYDATGNITRVSIDRSDADGAVRNEAELIKYDAMNREVLRASTWKAPSDTTWTTNLVKEVRYSKYGEITGRRSAATAGVAATPWQEYADYDSAGKVWRTNAGQGITKVLQYDLNGNVTRIRESQTTNLRPLGYAAAMMANADIFNTVSLYDKRNQVIKVIQPEMSGRADVPTLRASTIIPIGGGSVAGVPVQASTGAQQNPGADRATQAGDNFGLAGSQTVTTTTSGYLQGWGPGETNETLLTGTLQSVKVNLPNFSKIFGSAQVRVVVEFVATFSTTYGPFQQTGSEQRFVSGTGGELVVNFNRSIGASAYNAIPTAQITTITKVFLTPSGQSSETQVAVVNHNVSLEAEYVYGWDGEGYSWYQTGNILMNGQGSASTPLADQLRLRLHPSASRDRSFLYYKTSSGSFQRLATNDYSAPGPTGSWQTQPGFIGANVASLPRGSYELLLVSVDSQGNVLQHNLYNMQLGTTDAGTSLSLVTGSNNVAYTGNGWRVDRTGLYVRLADAVDFFDLRKSLDSATAEHAYRVKVTYKNTNGSTVSQNLYASSVLGKVTWNLSGVNLAQPIDIGLFSTTDQSLGELTGAITGQQPSFLYAHAKSSAVVFKWLPINIASASVTYVAAGGATGTISLKPTGTGEFYFDYVAAGLAQGSYQLKLSAWDSAGNLSYRSQASLSLGAVNSVVFSGEAVPATVEFNFYDGQYDSALMGAVTHVEMRYRPKGSQGDFQSTTITNNNGYIDYQSGKFRWQPLEALQDTDYEYYYDVYVSGGQMSSEPFVLVRNSGSFRPYSPTSTSNNQIQWIWDGFVDLAATIQRKQTYNAFGEVASETDGRDKTTNLYYNTMGLLTRRQQPNVTYTTATGLQASIRPDTYYYYDLLGQLVGVRDANTNMNTQAWRVGPDGKSMVVQEWHADLGVKKFGFDVFGNRRYSIDEEDRRTDYTYDAQGQLILVERPVDPNKGNARSTERYEYDQLGYRIASVDALGNRTKTYYDVANRVTRFVSPQGRATMNYAYTYDSTLVGIDGTVAGGWVRTTTNAANLYTTDKLDVFDRVLSHRDFGGHQFTYTYNKAGLISSQQGTSGQSISYAYYGNGLLASVTDNGAHTTSTYQYDKDGNRTREMYAVAGGTPLQNAVIQYDALNRVTSISGGDYDISYEYDAVGNRRRVYSKYTDGLGNTNVEQDYWYAYDAMNRFKVTMGQLAGARGGASTTIVAGTTGDGVLIDYDKAGQRKSAIYAGNSQTPAHTENYAYDANGYLTTVTIGGVVRAERVNDAAGRVVRYIERNESNSVRTDVTRTWDADGLQTLETDNQTGRTTTYTYSGEGSLNTVVSEGGGSAKTTTSYTYEWWDSAKQKEVKVQGDNGQSGWAPVFSRFTYDVNGNVKSATDVVGKREFRYLVDGDGQVLRRDEYLGSETNAAGELVSARGNRSHSYYYLGGHRVGNVGNDGVERVDYAQELSRTTPEQTKAEDYYKRFKPSAGADFDENYMPINSGYPGSAPGAYTVRTGETLRSIATSLWGDAALWWVLADA